MSNLRLPHRKTQHYEFIHSTYFFSCSSSIIVSKQTIYHLYNMYITKGYKWQNSRHLCIKATQNVKINKQTIIWSKTWKISKSRKIWKRHKTDTISNSLCLWRHRSVLQLRFVQQWTISPAKNDTSLSHLVTI